MRRHPLHSHRWLVPLGLALAVASCDSTTAIGGYTVTYRVGIDSTGVATFDSVKYDNGAGTMVKVATPAATWAVSQVLGVGATVEGHVWAKGATANHTAKFVVVWMTATGALAGDSTSHAVADTTHFALDLAKRTL
jgi:hypothetical protein